MTIYDLKPAFQNLLRPFCKALAKTGMTANQITVAAMLLSVFVGLLFALFPTSRWAALLIPVWLFLRMALNAIDGMLAREHHMQSDLGGILNELGDVISDTALYLPFALSWKMAIAVSTFVVEQAIYIVWGPTRGSQPASSTPAWPSNTTSSAVTTACEIPGE